MQPVKQIGCFFQNKDCMLKLNPDSRIRRRPNYMSKREKIISKWKDYIVDMTQSVENMNGRLVMITDMTLLLQPVIEKLGAYDTETLYKEFGPFQIIYDYDVSKIEIHLKENIIHEHAVNNL